MVALGFSLQQTSANPFAIALGEPAHRLNLAGGVNSFGTAIGPIVVAFALFGAATYSDDQIASINLSTVKNLYVAVGGLFLLAAAMFIEKNYHKQKEMLILFKRLKQLTC